MDNDSPDFDDLMEFAVRTATAAGQAAHDFFGATEVEFKGDGSEVTEADRAAEQLIRDQVAATFPEHGVFGEEGANVAASGDYRWIVDPIDGTRSFASGVALYAVLMALEYRGRPVLGCAHFPELGDTIVAADGAGCWWNGRRASVSSCDRLGDARLVTSGLEYWRDWGSARSKGGFDNLLGEVRFGRTWGDAYGYVLVATGRVEILADPACGAYWDYAPMLPILREAGGSFTTLGGGEVKAWTTALATNGHLLEPAIGFWGGVSDDSELQTEKVAEKRDS